MNSRYRQWKIDGFILNGPHDVDHPNSLEKLRALDKALNVDAKDAPDDVDRLERTLKGLKKANKITAVFEDLAVAGPPLAVGWLETPAPKGGIQALKKALERAGFKIARRCEEIETYG